MEREAATLATGSRFEDRYQILGALGSRLRKPIRLAGLALLLASSLSAQAQLDDVTFAEDLVRANHVEGLPYGEARKLTPAAVTRLIAMLADPAEAPHRVHIVMALGISGSEQAYPALAAFRARAPEGEIDAAQYRARRSLPLAMGHLARSDPRARRFLLEAVRGGNADSAPTWSYRHLRGKRLAGILQRAALTGLGISGRPESAAALQQLEAELGPQASDELHFHLLEARSLCDRVMREGPEAVFGHLGRPR